MSETKKNNLLPKEPYGTVDIEMLKAFSEANGICGHEKGASRVMARYLNGYADSVSYDNLGSIIGCKKGSGKGPKIAMFGHLDEVGFLVRKITEDGFLYLAKVGGMWPHLLLAQEVTITTRDDKEYVGVISSPPPHGMSPEERAKVKDVEDIFVDIGVNDADEVKALGIRVGDTATPRTQFRVLNNPNYLMGKAWDDRLGATVATAVLRNLKELRHEADVYAVGTVQEEVGLRGATTAGFAVNPDIAIALDVTLASDVPDSKYGTPLGTGVTLSLMDASVIANRELVYSMEKICERLGLTYTHDIFLRGGTDSGEIHKLFGGVLCMTISLPARAIHSHRGVIHRKDFADTVQLLTEFCRILNWDMVEHIRQSNR
ncbi:MAG: M42 family metallopeptidase [Angelakisella sp.]|nr:M42 family metallopeptidase [Angelakisella sp.]